MPPSTVRIVAADPRSPQAAHALAAYAAEVREAAGLTALDVGSALTDVDGFTAPGGCFRLAMDGRRVLGCVGLRALDDNDAEIKRMWVHPDHRGTGVAALLLQDVEDHARAAGYGRLVLDTHGALTAALRFYASHGYLPVPRYNDNPDATHFFAKELPA